MVSEAVMEPLRVRISWEVIRLLRELPSGGFGAVLMEHW
jgi:hypothetical protein